MAVMKKFRSCAEWEQKHGFYKNITMDTHDTKEQAVGVCKLLEREGLGGENIWFPTRLWVEEWQEIPTPDGFGLAWVEVS